MADIPWDELMDAAEGSDFAPVPQSDYDVKISATEATTSSTDKPMWKITADIESGPHEGRKLFTQQTLTMDNPNALNIFFRQMAAAGLTSEFFKTKPNNQQIADALLGRRFRAKVIIKEYQGLPRNEIKAWNPPAGAGGAPGGPPPPGAAAASPPPPPTTTPPAASAPPPPPAPSAPPPPPAAAPPAAAPAAAEPTPVTASAGPPPAASAPPAASGGADAWVVQERASGSTEEPPF